METEMLEIRNFTEQGYQPLVAFGEWRVAALRYHEGSQPERIHTMERHLATDEVFVLTHGSAILILGGNGAEVGELQPFDMQIGPVYNVKKGAWHTTLLSRDAHIIIVENDNTGKENSESAALNTSHLRAIQTVARSFFTGK